MREGRKKGEGEGGREEKKDEGEKKLLSNFPYVPGAVLDTKGNMV